jgi:EmrB/QacA subfamily drug resistance transporter
VANASDNPVNASAPAVPDTPSFKPTLIALIVAVAFFMENLDGTVIATALPQMGDSLGAGTIQMSIGITAYILTLAIFIPASGWMADHFGTRNVFGGAIALFTLSSVACGFSQDFYTFIASRIVQGTAAALMSPVGRLVVLRSTEKKDLLRAAAITVWPGLVAPVIGPPLGGFITTYATWRWIFFLNVPLGLLGIAMVLRYVGNYRDETKRPFDGVGFALSGTALGALMYGFDRVGVRDWLDAGVLIVMGIALGLLAVRHAGRKDHPLVELSAMRVKSFSVSVWGGLLFRMTVGATPVLLPLMFQRGFGLSAFEAGTLTLAYALGNLGMKPFTTPILRFFGFRNVMLYNGLLSAVCILACGFLTPVTPTVVLFTLLVLTGGFRSLGLTCLFTLPYVDVSPAQRSAATTLMSVVQQVGFGLGVAFGSVALQASLMARGAGADALTVADFRLAFVAVALLGMLVLPNYLRLDADAGVEVSGHKRKKTADAKNA